MELTFHKRDKQMMSHNEYQKWSDKIIPDLDRMSETASEAARWFASIQAADYLREKRLNPTVDESFPYPENAAE